MKTTFTLIFALLSISAFSQRNFVAGQYTTLQGDVLMTHINDQNWGQNPSFIEVSNNPESNELLKLTPETIQGFAITSGDRFEAFTVDIDKSPYKLQDISPNEQPLIINERVFLRALVKGKVSLYYLKDEQLKEHYFIKIGDGMPVELINRIFKSDNGVAISVNKAPIYRGQLNNLLVDCIEVTRNISELNYNRKSLQKLIIDYNNCDGSSGVEYVAPVEKFKFNIIALGGITHQTLSIERAINDEFNDASFSGLNYTAGISLKATLPRSNGRWSIINDIMFKPMKFDGISEDNSNPNQVKKINTTFDIGYMGLNTLVRYKLLNYRLKPFINIGLSNNFMVYDRSNQVVYKKFYSSETTTEGKPFDDMRKYEQAINWGFGIELNKFLAEIKVEHGNGFSAYQAVETFRRNISLNIGYVIN